MSDHSPNTAPGHAPSHSPGHAPVPPNGWGAAPAAGPTATLDGPPVAPPGQSAWGAAPVGPAARTGQPSGTAGRTRPKPPWFWPVVAVAVGLGALLAGGGVGYAIGHAIGASHSSSVTVPGGGRGGFPGQDGQRGQSGQGGQLPGGVQGGGSGTGS